MKTLPARSRTTPEVVEALLLALSVGSPLRRVSGTFPSLPAAGKMSAQAQHGKTRAKRARPRAQLRWHHHWRRPSRPRARRLSRQGWTRHSRCRAAAHYGGGLSTKEATEPGFYHNLHSINHFHISEAPWFKDLGLGERVTYITPRYEFG